MARHAAWLRNRASRADNLQSRHGALSSQIYSTDHAKLYPADSTTSQMGVLKSFFPTIPMTYEGKVAPDGKTITGSWKGDGAPIPLNFERATKETAWAIDSTLHKVTFSTVEPGVKVEVVDWGGTGRPLVLLTGLGDNAHIFDTFAPKLTGKYHVYGITRRGFGASDTPPPIGDNYSADRLGDDVLAVLNQLKLDRPVLAAHSIGGEELSSIGSRYPERVAGLIYVDAGYWYALYPGLEGGIEIDGNELRKKLQAIQDATTPQEQRGMVEEVLKTDMPRYQQELVARDKDLLAMPDTSRPPEGQMKSRDYISKHAVHSGEQRYTQLKCPVLAIFNVPKASNSLSDTEAKVPPKSKSSSEIQAAAFATLGPNVRVVRIPGAAHYIFRSNESDVLREINAFIATLP
jgi:non-heme chloroperoxidase